MIVETWLYSATTGGFYGGGLDYPGLPADVIEISEAAHNALMAAQAAGKRIEADQFGIPQSVDPPQLTAEQLRADMSLSFAQLLIGLVAEGWITEAEGDAWLAGVLPAAVLALIATLPAGARFAARARAARPSVVLRTDPLVAGLAAATGKTAAQLDTFFLTYAQA